MALEGRRSTVAHTTTNQQQAAVTEEWTEMRCNEWEPCGKRDTVTFEGVKSKKKYSVLNKIRENRRFLLT